MRLKDMPFSLLSLVVVILARPTFATPPQLEDQVFSLDKLQDVEKRCANPCGYYGQLCCASNEYCYTDSNSQAQCGQAAVTSQVVVATVGQWEYYTTTYVETDLQTITTTFSSFVPSNTCSIPCGGECCLSGQFCASDNTCKANGGSQLTYTSVIGPGTLYTVTTIITNTASLTAGPAIRPTSSTIVTITTTSGSATITTAYSTPVTTAGVISEANRSGGGLSGGAIAGIVIGVILGIILLLIICLCCCAKGILDGFLAIFGLGPRSRRRTEETEIYEERRHSGSGGRTWFGTRPSRTEKVERRGSGWGGLAGVAAALGGLAILLRLKRKRREEKTSTGYGSSYFSSDYTSASSESSAGRTRDSRRSRSRR